MYPPRGKGMPLKVFFFFYTLRLERYFALSQLVREFVLISCRISKSFTFLEISSQAYGLKRKMTERFIAGHRRTNRVGAAASRLRVRWRQKSGRIREWVVLSGTRVELDIQTPEIRPVQFPFIPTLQSLPFKLLKINPVTK